MARLPGRDQGPGQGEAHCSYAFSLLRNRFSDLLIGCFSFSFFASFFFSILYFKKMNIDDLKIHFNIYFSFIKEKKNGSACAHILNYIYN